MTVPVIENGFEHQTYIKKTWTNKEKLSTHTHVYTHFLIPVASVYRVEWMNIFVYIHLYVYIHIFLYQLEIDSGNLFCFSIHY